MEWFNNMKIGKKVVVASVIFILLIISVSIQGITVMNNSVNAFHNFYSDRFIPVRQLNLVMKHLLQIRINMLQEQLAAEQRDWKEVNARIESSKALTREYKEAWNEFASRNHEKKEEKLEEWILILI